MNVSLMDGSLLREHCPSLNYPRRQHVQIGHFKNNLETLVATQSSRLIGHRVTTAEVQSSFKGRSDCTHVDDPFPFSSSLSVFDFDCLDA